jgi:8-oxo-dGTP pyrophosphatase MutT (NUDIX family)
LPEDHVHQASLVGQSEPGRPQVVRPKHAASLIVVRLERAASAANEPQMLMGTRGARHRFMPNRLVFPGGRVDRVDLSAPSATPLSAHTERLLQIHTNARLARGLAHAAARELLEETGLSLGTPPRLDRLHYLARAVTPPNSPIRFNARFFAVFAEDVTGTLGGDGELEGLRFYPVSEALALDLALPTRRVLERLQIWLGMTEAERTAQVSTPVLLRDRGWRME